MRQVTSPWGLLDVEIRSIFATGGKPFVVDRRAKKLILADDGTPLSSLNSLIAFTNKFRGRITGVRSVPVVPISVLPSAARTFRDPSCALIPALPNLLTVNEEDPPISHPANP